MSYPQHNQISRQAPVFSHGPFDKAFNKVKNCASFGIRVTGERMALDQESGEWKQYSQGFEIRGESEEVARERMEKEMALEIEKINYEYQFKASQELQKMIFAKSKLNGEYEERINEIEAQARLYKEQLDRDLKMFENEVEHAIKKSGLDGDRQISEMQMETQNQAIANNGQVNLNRIDVQRQVQTRELNAQKEINLARMAIDKQLADIENYKRSQFEKEANNYEKDKNQLECNFRANMARLESEKQIAIAQKRNKRRWYQFFHS
ncbi:unnamed protein product [Blepharisma stoltei]|uniref:Uncharacterized protein n=1 Tax=Blepharisma stoltei TaxID=1481888 RepID=A0AAU9IJG9_9CILI|nr:unnamed protein product [Blepharisma stoltei]